MKDEQYEKSGRQFFYLLWVCYCQLTCAFGVTKTAILVLTHVNVSQISGKFVFLIIYKMNSKVGVVEKVG